MEPELELFLPQALDLGLRLLREDQLDAAEHVYTSILAQHPEQPDSLHYLGLVKHRRGQLAAAIKLMRHAIELAPGHAWMWNNLGNILVEQERLDEALTAYRQCLALTPDAADAWGNLGSLHRKCRRLVEAEDACRRSVTLQPDHAIGWFNLARVLIERGDIHAGLIANSKAVVLAPRDHTSRYRVTRALVLLGETERAAEAYREWLADEPDNALVKHHLAACQGDNSQPRAPDAYVESVFDSFAPSFDAKLQSLGYRAPQLIADLLAKRLPCPNRSLQVADVGCGTGLCGPLVRDWARHLVGCDLSSGMLRLAKERAVYDELEKAELVAYLQLHPDDFDLLISADTLCYFGDLSGLAQAAFDALRVGGRLMFTVEALAAGGDTHRSHRLLHHGRYAHSRSYLSAVLRGVGFVVEDLTPELLRYESGLPVEGFLVNARKHEILIAHR